MSGVEWQWRDGGSGPGHLQSVLSHKEFVRHQTAYQKYFEHASACPDCVDGVCPEARRLWRVVRGREQSDE
ncbi:hypothetical protein [Streptomyces sp. NBC_00038]|uniref:hypothetical protein n=1 Tax=Streptomyces sp. NBC_00038 TaxID=2903615 RepID=UPI00225B9881|nr:hypothetical protein [Streptomyces sp. NBC_00038]MCX5561715.1 hypothetical protein [Streptomyces sp. NBC_00038]